MNLPELLKNETGLRICDDSVVTKVLESLWPQRDLKYMTPLSVYKIEAFTRSFAFREIYTSNGIWGIPCKESIKDIQKYVNPERHRKGRLCPQNTILEVMGGTGYLSYWLRKYGKLDVVCTDLLSSEEVPSGYFNYHVDISKKWVSVEPLKASDAVLAYPGRSVLASWIPYGGCKGHDELKMLQNMAPGQKLILIGEGQGGCCASDDFFEMLKTDFKEDGYGRWISPVGIHDNMTFHVKKRNKKCLELPT